VSRTELKSLKSYVTKRLLGYIVLASLAIGGVAFLFARSMVRTESRTHALNLARATAKSFRPLILAKQERSAYFQIKQNLGLSSVESLTILDASGNEIYPNDTSVGATELAIPACPAPIQGCAISNQGFIITRVPIFYDDTNQTLAAELVLKTKSPLDIVTMFELVGIIMALFAALSIGILSLLKNVYRDSNRQLALWAARIQNNIKSYDEMRPPFAEFENLSWAINGLRTQVEKLESTAETAARTRLLREVAHDLRTPISQLAKYIEIIALKASSQMSIDPVDIERVRGAMQRSSELIRQVSDMTPASEDGSASTDLREWLNDYQSRIKDLDLIKDKSLRLLAEVPSSAEASIPVSSINVFRVIDNLVRNAADFSPTGGQIQIQARNTNDSVVIEVTDEGPGIPEENRERIFQADFSTKPSRGTGLGLSTVSAICQRYGASISFSNRAPRGTTFRLEFPRSSLGGNA
jgi:signal transduction histidine kinase